jgi:hypothetical protein
MSSNIPYLRKKTPSTLFAFSAIVLLLLASSPMSLSFNHLLLQPVQAADAPMTFKTPKPATMGNETLTFEAHGTNATSGLQTMTGTWEMNEGQYGGNITAGTFMVLGPSYGLTLFGNERHNSIDFHGVTTVCSTDSAIILPNTGIGPNPRFQGPVECSLDEEHATTEPSSSMTGTTTTTQDRGSDSDGDGIPDSSDKCTHNSNHRCFKEGDTTTTSTDQPQSSSNGNGNQTR